MTEQEMMDYCKVNVPIRIEPTEYNGCVIHFLNGEWVTVRSSYDGLYYTCSNEPPVDNSKLFEQIRESSEDFINSMQEKYSKGFDYNEFLNPKK